MAATDVRLDVNLASGDAHLVFNGAQQISAYEIDSPSGQLAPNNWNSLSSHGNPGWFTLGSSAATIAEGNFSGSLTADAPIDLGAIFTPNGQQDLTFRWADANNNLFVSTVVYISQTPDLAITKSHVGSFRQGDAADQYTIHVSNVGTGGTNGDVIVTDALPAGLTPIAATGDGWNATIDGATVTASRRDSLAAKQDYPPLVITVKVANNASPIVTNIATIAGGGDSNSENNSASDPTSIIQAADLSISKSHEGAFHLGDLADKYSVVVRNVGAGATIGEVKVVDALPAGLTPVNASGDGWTTKVEGSTITATRSDALGANESYPTLVITVKVANDAPSSVVNIATVSGGGELNGENNSAADATTIDAEAADLTLTKSHLGVFRQGDAADQYSIVVRNIGSLDTTGLATVTDTLPAGLTPTAATGDGWQVKIEGATVTATRNDSLKSGASYPPLIITVRVANNAAPSLVNTATVSGGNERNLTNNSADDPTTIAQAADLTIQKSHVGVFRQGDPSDSYQLVVRNTGAGPTINEVTVVDALPGGLTPIAASGDGWQVTIVGSTVTAKRNDALDGGQDFPNLTILVRVADDATDVVNVATVSGGGELNAENNSASDATTIEARTPDLVIVKTHVGSFRQGDESDRYRIVVTNAGFASTIGAVTVVDTLPNGLTPIAAAGDGWQVQIIGSKVTAVRNDPLSVNASFPELTIDVRVAADAAPSLTNTAVVSGGGELNAENNTASDVTLIAQAADLTIEKTHVGDFRQGDPSNDFTIAVRNIGPGPTVGVVKIVDALPAGLIPTAAVGDGWQTEIVGTTVTATRSGSLESNANYPPLKITVRVANDAPPRLANVATVSGGGELNAANSSATDETTIAQAADLTIAKTHSGDFRQGDQADVYTVVIHNSGSGATIGLVTITDALPAGLIPISVAGDGWQTQIVGATVTATRDDALESNANYPPLKITVRVANDAPAQVVNAATVSGGGQLNMENDGDNDPTNIIQAADLSIAKSHVGSFEQGQNDASYSIVVTNAGAGGTTGEVKVTDTLPAGLTPISASGDGWQTEIDGATIVATRGDLLASSQSYPKLTIVVRVAGDAPNSITNVATVAGGGELNAANNSSSDATAISAGTASLSGYAYIDADNDGKRLTPAGQSGVLLPNIEIHLLRRDLEGHWSEVTGKSPALTRFDGLYSFTGLPAAAYRLQVSLPDTLLDGLDTPGTIAGVPRGVASKDQLEVELRRGEMGVDYNFGMLGIKPNWLSLRLLLSSTPLPSDVILGFVGPLPPKSLQIPTPPVVVAAFLNPVAPTPPLGGGVNAVGGGNDDGDSSLNNLVVAQATASAVNKKKKRTALDAVAVDEAIFDLATDLALV